MSLLSDIHFELSLVGLVPETDPFAVCPVEYRQNLERALTRAMGCDPDELTGVAQQLEQTENALTEADLEIESLTSDLQRARSEHERELAELKAITSKAS